MWLSNKTVINLVMRVGFFWVGVKADMVIRNCSSVAVLCVFQGGWGAYFSLYMCVHLKKKICMLLLLVLQL